MPRRCSPESKERGESVTGMLSLVEIELSKHVGQPVGLARPRRRSFRKPPASVLELSDDGARRRGLQRGKFEIAREPDIADSVVRSRVRDADQTAGKESMTTNEDLQRELADGEHSTTTETNEAGDDGVSIVVDANEHPLPSPATLRFPQPRSPSCEAREPSRGHAAPAPLGASSRAARRARRAIGLLVTHCEFEVMPKLVPERPGTSAPFSGDTEARAEAAWNVREIDPTAGQSPSRPVRDSATASRR